MFILTVHLSTSACWVNSQIYCLTRWALLSSVCPSPSPGWTDTVNMHTADHGPARLCWGLRVSQERLQEPEESTPRPHRHCSPFSSQTFPPGQWWNCQQATVGTQAGEGQRLKEMGDKPTGHLPGDEEAGRRQLKASAVHSHTWRLQAGACAGGWGVARSGREQRLQGCLRTGPALTPELQAGSCR